LALATVVLHSETVANAKTAYTYLRFSNENLFTALGAPGTEGVAWASIENYESYGFRCSNATATRRHRQMPHIDMT